MSAPEPTRPFSRKRLDSGIVETTVTGHMNMQAILAAIADLQPYIQDGHVFELIDHRETCSLELSFDISQVLISRTHESFRTMGHSATALICPTDVIFGYCRQLQQQVEARNLPMQIGVFRTRTEGVAWLEEQMKAGGA